MVRMLSIIITAIFIPFIIPNDNLYNDYKQLMKKRYGISITIPDSLVSYENKLNPDRLMFFGESSVGGPIFQGGALVRLSPYCNLLLEETLDRKKPTSKDIKRQKKMIERGYHTIFESMLLVNCNLPWLHKEHSIEIQHNAQLNQIITDTLERYVQSFEKTKINKHINADYICIVHIPNVHKVCNKQDFMNQHVITHNKKAGVEQIEQCSQEKHFICYGVELTSFKNLSSVKMLFFINPDGAKTIDDYVEEISRYIRFD